MIVGLFFIIPCIDNIIKVDLRTVTFDVPPQEVCVYLFYKPRAQRYQTGEICKNNVIQQCGSLAGNYPPLRILKLNYCMVI